MKKRVDLTDVKSMHDLQTKLKQALSMALSEKITVESWDEDFSDWCQLHSIESCPPMAKLRISRVNTDPSAPSSCSIDQHVQESSASPRTISTTTSDNFSDRTRRKLSKRDRSLSAKEALPSPTYSKRYIPSAHPNNNKKVTYNGMTFLAGMPKRHTGQAQKENKAKPRRWTPEEDKLLLDAVAVGGARNWKGIAKQVPGRNHTQCLQRYAKVLKPGLVKGHWTDTEDKTLTTLVQSGWTNWGQIADKINGRTSKQCRERWFHHLDPSIKRGDYTAEEDDLILALHDKLGNKWSQIAHQLEGRTEDAVKIRWKTLNRHRRQGKPVGSEPGGNPNRRSAAGSTAAKAATLQPSAVVSGAGVGSETGIHSDIATPGASGPDGQPSGSFSQQLGLGAPATLSIESGPTHSIGLSTSNGASASTTTRSVCAKTTAIDAALGNLEASFLVTNTAMQRPSVGSATNPAANMSSKHGLGQSYGQNVANPSNYASMEWLESCLKSLETMDVVQSRDRSSAQHADGDNGAREKGGRGSVSSINTSILNSNCSLFDSIGDRDGFDRLVLQLVQTGKEYLQVRQHLVAQFGRPLTEAEKTRINFIIRTADHVGMPPVINRSTSTSISNHDNSSGHSMQSQSLHMRTSGTGPELAAIDLDLFDSNITSDIPSDMAMRLSTGSTGSLGSISGSITVAGIGVIGGEGSSMSRAHASKYDEHNNGSARGGHGKVPRSSASFQICGSTDTTVNGTAKSGGVADGGVLSPGGCRDSESSLERNSFSMDAIRASLTQATAC